MPLFVSSAGATLLLGILEEQEASSFTRASLENITTLAKALVEHDEKTVKELIPFVHLMTTQEGPIPGDEVHVVGVRFRDKKQIVINDKPDEVYGEGFWGSIVHTFKPVPPPKEIVIGQESFLNLGRLVIYHALDLIEESEGELGYGEFSVTRKEVEETVAKLAEIGMKVPMDAESRKESLQFYAYGAERQSLPIEAR